MDLRKLGYRQHGRKSCEQRHKRCKKYEKRALHFCIFPLLQAVLVSTGDGRERPGPRCSGVELH
eukprot:1478073-Karenia_brevis.AAC.1